MNHKTTMKGPEVRTERLSVKITPSAAREMERLAKLNNVSRTDVLEIIFAGKGFNTLVGGQP